MQTEKLIEILQKHITKVETKDSDIVDYQNNVLNGFEFTLVLSHTKNSYYVFFSTKVDGVVYSNINLRKFNFLDQAKEYYEIYKKILLSNNLNKLIEILEDEKKEL